MQNNLSSIRKAVSEGNHQAALYFTLAIPDICAALQHGRTSGDRYSDWWEAYMPAYAGFLSGSDCYALRCAALHMGSADVTTQKRREVIEHFVFMTSGPHMNLFENCVFNGVTRTFLQLNVSLFCEDVCLAVEKWMADVAADPDIQKRIGECLIVHEPGYVHLGLIKFG